MVNSMVERATSDMLIGPDWAMNIEICDICNRDPSQAKDVVKGIKKRLGSRNSKVQLLALTLLETIVKNCGDFVHLHVAERDVLHEMVRIVKKKPDFHVKEKILILIDTWQEAFGGARARYPQYYAAYQELLRMGAVFPQKSESTAPVFTPPQTQPLTSYPQNLRNIENGNGNEAAESSAEAEFPTLSLTEIQNARGIMDVLTEMLTAIDPANKEGLRQEVIVDLVEQCRTYKQRVVHLVNSTSDESLLCQGLALNDDLQRLLAKHESLLSGTAVPGEKPKNETTSKALVPVDAPLIDTGDSKQPNAGSTSGASAGLELVSLAPITTNAPSTTPAKLNPKFDLLSGDDFGSPTAENSLALVSAGEPHPTTASQQNTLALVDMFSQSNNTQSNSPAGQAYSSSTQFQQQPPQGFQQSPFYPNGSVPTVGQGHPQYEQQSPYAQGNSSAWNQMSQQQPQQPQSPVYGGQSSGALPPPPWEAQPADNNQYGSPQYPQPVQVTTQVVVTHSAPPPNNIQPMGPTDPQITGTYMQTINNQPIHPHQLQGGAHPMGMPPQQFPPGQMSYMYPQQMPQQMPQQLPQQMYNNQMGGGYGYGYGYNYGQQQQQQNNQFLEQRMSGLAVRDDSVMKNSSYYSTQSSYVPVPSGKPTRPEDKLFGDLVDFAKVNPSTKNTTTTPGRAGSM